MEYIFKEQNLLNKRISQFLSNVKKEPLDRRNKDIAIKKLVEIKGLWDEFNKNDNKLREDPDMANPYFTDEVYSITEQCYNDIITLLDRYTDNSDLNNDRTSEELQNEDDKKKDNKNIVKKDIKRLYLRLTRLQNLAKEANDSLATPQPKSHYEQTISSLSQVSNNVYNMLEDILLDLEEENNESKEISEKTESIIKEVNTTIILIRQAAEKTAQDTSKKQPKLPPVAIPKFNGQFNSWVTFKNLFFNVIHDNATLSNVEKLRYLQMHLEGEAGKMISHLQLTNENYMSAFNLITERYDNKRKICDMYFDMLLDLPQTNAKSAFSLKTFHDTLKECLEGLKAVGIQFEESSLIARICIRKLDAENLKAFEEGFKNPKKIPSLDVVLQFLESRFLILEAVNEKKHIPSKSSGVASNLVTHNKLACACCNETHKIAYCKKFLDLSVRDRNKVIFKNKICKNCMMHKNNSKCSSNGVCKHCGMKHHSLLHYSSNKDEAKKEIIHATPKSCTTDCASCITSNYVEKDETVLLSTALVYIKKGCGNFEKLRALIDQGSQASLITEAAAQQLGLQKVREEAQVTGVGAGKPRSSKYKISIEIRPHFPSNSRIETFVHVLPKLTGDLPHELIQSNIRNKWNNIVLADPSFDTPGPIDIILGADIYGDIIMKGVRLGNPSAIQTKLGWILNGRISKLSTTKKLNLIETNISVVNIEKSMSRFWEIEEPVGVDDGKLDKKLLDSKINICRNINGRYQVNLPFKNDTVSLGKSRNQAIARLLHLEKSLNSNPEKKREYHSFMREYLDLGHMVQIDVAEPSKGYYIPHHAIWKKDNITTKLRVVFDASAATSNGRSLNDELMVGPTVQQGLTTILTRWRTHRFVFSADIKQMYRQVLIADEDQEYQKILWRFSSLDPIREFKLTTVTYGTSSASYLAIRALQQLADDESLPESNINRIIKDDFYVDDLMSGGNSREEAKSVIYNVNKVVQKGGFILRKWASNDLSLLDQIPQDLRLESLVEINTDSSIKTLGIWWNPSSDEFSYKFNNDAAKVRTKRVFLSNISKIFDPMGWIAPITINVKMMMQEVWAMKLGWDNALPQSFQKRWENLEYDLQSIQNINIPRYLQFTNEIDMEIHGFCDASERAYAAVIYSRVSTINGYVIRLLGAKTRVAPLNKKHSIPRLELCGAQLLVKYAKEVSKSFAKPIPIQYWTDSTITLAWIKGPPQRWKSFVAHRVAEISESSSFDQWNHVGSKFNPADIASRGATANQINNIKLWWNGPDWLKENWRQQIQTNDFTTDVEQKSHQDKYDSYSVEINSNIDNIISKFSSLGRIIRVISYIRRFKNKYRGPISVAEINDTTACIIKLIQAEEFSLEISLLKNQKINQIKNKFLQLNPFLDDNNIMRVGGRLDNLKIKTISKHPIIIPTSHHFTKMIVEHAHKITMHGGSQLTLAYIRQTYWIPNAKRIVRKIIHNCVRCHRFRAEAANQIMGNLPVERIHPSSAFTNTGVDYAGPIEIKVAKGRGIKAYKGFISVFVCLATRALHLEVVSDMTSEAFIAAYKRFTSRRGHCLNVYSDNGTNFVGANNQMKREFQNIMKDASEELAKIAIETNTKWHFIPPHAPHFGGIWEAGVKSIKYHLRRVIGEQRLTFEELTTVLNQIEACLNSRPIAPLSEDPTETDALTPGHFLIGRPIIAKPETDSTNINYCTRWKLLTKLVQGFWKVWSNDYLNQLQQRRKWKTSKDNVSLGDLVLIKDDNLPPTKWSLGRISEIYPGKDDIVRTVTLKTAGGELKRPIVKICPLPKCEEESTDAVKTYNNKKHLQVLSLTKHSSECENSNKSKNSERKKSDSCRGFELILLFLMLLFSMCSSTASEEQYFEVNPFPHQPGIYFEDVGKMRFQQFEWNLIIHYNLSMYKDIIQNLHSTMNHLEAICHHSDIMCAATLLECKYLMFNINTSNSVLMNSNKEHTRYKRGLIDGVGYIANELFGVLDSRSAKKYEDQIHELQVNQQFLVELAKNHTSITDGTLKLFSENALFLQEELRHLNETLQMQMDQHSYMDITLKMTLTMIRVKDIQGTMLNIILDTHQGRINPILLPPTSLTEELKHIKNHLPPNVILPDIINGNLADIYSLMSVKSRLTTDNIIFSIKIPLPNIEINDVFKLIPLPITHKNESFIIAPSSQYLIINVQKDHFYPLNSDELDVCSQTSNNIRICKPHKPIYNMQSNESKCEVLLINHNDNYLQMCTVHQHIKTSQWIQLSQPNSWIFSMIDTYFIDIVCDSKLINNTVLQGQGIIHLKPGCIIKQNGLTIIAHNAITNHIKYNFFPLVQSEKILSSKGKHEIKGLQISTADIQTQLHHLQEAVNQQRTFDENSHSFKNHTVHHYMIYCIIVGIIAISYFLIKQYKKIKHVSSNGPAIRAVTSAQAESSV